MSHTSPSTTVPRPSSATPRTTTRWPTRAPVRRRRAPQDHHRRRPAAHLGVAVHHQHEVGRLAVAHHDVALHPDEEAGDPVALGRSGDRHHGEAGRQHGHGESPAHGLPW